MHMDIYMLGVPLQILFALLCMRELSLIHKFAFMDIEYT